jgi:hypothetical protein
MGLKRRLATRELSANARWRPICTSEPPAHFPLSSSSSVSSGSPRAFATSRNIQGPLSDFATSSRSAPISRAQRGDTPLTAGLRCDPWRPRHRKSPPREGSAEGLAVLLATAFRTGQVSPGSKPPRLFGTEPLQGNLCGTSKGSGEMRTSSQSHAKEHRGGGAVPADPEFFVASAFAPRGAKFGRTTSSPPQ